MEHRCRMHDEDTLGCIIEFSRLPSDESLHHIIEYHGLRQLKAKYDIQAKQRVSESPDLRLAGFFRSLIRHAPRLSPVTHTIDATASALVQDPVSDPLWTKTCSSSGSAWRRSSNTYPRDGRRRTRRAVRRMARFDSRRVHLRRPGRSCSATEVWMGCCCMRTFAG